MSMGGFFIGSRSGRYSTISHSFDAVGQSNSGNVVANTGGSTHFWLSAMMGPRLDAPFMTYGKHGGQGSAAMVAGLANYVPEMIAKKINISFWNGVINNSLSSMSATDALIADITTIAKAHITAGIPLIVTDDCPSGQGSVTDYRKSTESLAGFARIRQFCLYDLPRLSPLIYPIETYKVFVDPALGTGVPKDAAMFAVGDQMHPTPRGHFRRAYEIYKVIDKLFPVSNNEGVADLSDLYNATYNKRGNLLNNPTFSGDQGGGNAGKATSWTITAPAGLTATCTKDADADGTIVQRVAYTGTLTTANTAGSIRQDPSTGRFNSGDTHRGGVYVLLKKSDAAVGFTNLRCIGLSCGLTDGGSPGNYSTGAGDASMNTGDTWPNDFDFSQFNGGKGLWFRTPENTITSAWNTGQFARFAVTPYFDAAAATDLVIELRQAEWKKTGAASGY